MGPALLVATKAATKVPRSEVIICTDGLSNVGIGSMEVETKAGKAFYKRLAKEAKEKETTISVIGIQGDNCGVAVLGTCADISGGYVSFVNALEVQRKMREIVRNPVIATDVVVKVILPPSLVFRKYGKVSSKSILELDIGNVTSDCDITFEFAPRDADEGVSTASAAASAAAAAPSSSSSHKEKKNKV